MLSVRIKNFIKGLITRIEPESIPDGSASNSLNWTTDPDRIALRRGQRRLGSDAGTGKVTGLAVATTNAGTERLYRTRGRKVEYYDLSSTDWTEIGTDTLPAAASGEEVSFAPYTNLAGAALYLSSPNSSIYKIMLANPTSITDLLSTTFRGYLKASLGRMFLWNQKGSTGGQDKTSVYGSYIDKDELTDYTQIANENCASGNGVLKTFTGTLAFKAANSKRTCFFVTFTDSVETFTDNYDGTLTGTAGGTGTINYTTGEYSITFAVAPLNAANNVKATYYWEDSTSQGPADFTKSTPRTAGQGFVFLQTDGGGDLLGIADYRDTQYCLHRRKTWALNITNTDTNATNLPSFPKVGIPNWRAWTETGQGIYYVDDIDESDPHIRLLTLNAIGTEVEPQSISEAIDLTNYRFDQSVVYEWGDLILVACRTSDSSVNNRVLAYNKVQKSWEIHDYRVSCFATYNGTLVAGDTATNNVYELFSGVDDDDSEIPNYWIGNISDFKTPNLKKVKRLVLQGTIGPDQELDVYLSPDRGAFVKVGTIQGSGSYVDRTANVSVGATTLGRKEVGGGGLDGQIPAYNFECAFPVALGKFETLQIKFQATKVGWASVSLIEFRDIRTKERRLPTKYR